MADGFYTNDEYELGCFGGYGSDGAEFEDKAMNFAGGFASRPPGTGQAGGAGEYGTRLDRPFFALRFSSHRDQNGDYGRTT